MFKVIYADPSWSYNDKTPRGGAEKHYRTLSLAQVCDLQVNGQHVSKIAAPDCALFIWGTWPLIFDVKTVIDAWGFKYKNCAWAWVKTTKAGTPKMGLGHWSRGNTEPCLLAVRGKPLRVDKGVPQVIWEELEEETLFSPLGRHSAKPPEARERIIRLLGDVPRIELFARERAPGWEAFGDELPKITDPQEAKR